MCHPRQLRNNIQDAMLCRAGKDARAPAVDLLDVLDLCYPLLDPGSALVLCLVSKATKASVHAQLLADPRVVSTWLRDAARRAASGKDHADRSEDYDQLEDETEPIWPSRDPADIRAARKEVQLILWVAKDIWGDDYPQQIDLPGALLAAGQDATVVSCLLQGLPAMPPSFLLECAKHRVQIGNLIGKLQLACRNSNSSPTQLELRVLWLWQLLQDLRQGGTQSFFWFVQQWPQEQQIRQEQQQQQRQPQQPEPQQLLPGDAESLQNQSEDELHRSFYVLLGHKNSALVLLPRLLHPECQHWSPAQVHELLLLAFQQPRSGAAALPHLTRLQQAHQLSWKQLQQLAGAAGRHGGAQYVLSLLPTNAPIPPHELLLIAKGLFSGSNRPEEVVEEQLLQLPAAQQWGWEDVLGLITSSVLSRWMGGRVRLLAGLPGARRIPLRRLQELLSMLTQREYVPPLLNLPAAARLPAAALQAVISTADVWYDWDVLGSILAHPAAAALPPDFLLDYILTSYYPDEPVSTLGRLLAHPLVQAAPLPVVRDALLRAMRLGDCAPFHWDNLFALPAVQAMDGDELYDFLGEAMPQVCSAGLPYELLENFFLPFLALPGAQGLSASQILCLLDRLLLQQPQSGLCGLAGAVKLLAKLPAAADVTAADVAHLIEQALAAADSADQGLHSEVADLAEMPCAAELQLPLLLQLLRAIAAGNVRQDSSALLQLPAVQAGLTSADVSELMQIVTAGMCKGYGPPRFIAAVVKAVPDAAGGLTADVLGEFLVAMLRCREVCPCWCNDKVFGGPFSLEALLLLPGVQQLSGDVVEELLGLVKEDCCMQLLIKHLPAVSGQ